MAKGLTVQVIACFVVFIYESLVYNLIFAWQILPAAGKDFLQLTFLILYNVFWILAAWSYLKTRCSEPGRLPDRWDGFVQHQRGVLPVGTSKGGWQPGRVTSCKKCNGRVRPERAHHCSVSDHCVLRMDHYCPWTGNCVGFKNHKFFLLLLIYGLVCGLFAVASSVVELITASGCLFQGGASCAQRSLGVNKSLWVAFLVFGFLAVSVSCMLTILLVQHFPLALRNCTSIEELYSNMDNPYDLGDGCANLSELFGEFGCDWFLPVQPCRPMCDGLSFRTAGEVLPPQLEDALADSASENEDNAAFGFSRPPPEALWSHRYSSRSQPQGAGW